MGNDVIAHEQVIDGRELRGMTDELISSAYVIIGNHCHLARPNVGILK